MNPKQIVERLTAAHTALVDKIGAQPFISPTMTIGDKVSIHIYRDLNGGDYDLGTVSGEIFEDVCDKMDAFIAALPDPEELAKRAFQKNLAKVIDEGESINSPKEVMTLLRAGMEAMNENLLTYSGERQ